MNRANDEDRALAERLAQDRDPVAFDQLYRRHTPMLFRIAMRRTRNGTEAEDAVHDAWIRAVAGLGQFRGASSVRTWLTAILINRLREGERSRRYDSLDDLPELAAAEPASLPTQIDPIDLSRALEAMPNGYHEVLLLHDIEGFTHEEIGELLGIEVGTSKSQLARGRRWLRERLQKMRDTTHD